MSLVEAERKLGFESRLITLGGKQQGREGDVTLNLPLLDSSAVRAVKRLVTPKARRTVTNQLNIPDEIPLVFQPGNPLEAALFSLREKLWRRGILEQLRAISMESFDLIQLDGGLGFFRDGRIVTRLKMEGKKVICLYTGSDLRTRGVIPAIDAIADLNVTVEIDHLKLHPGIHHVPFPLNMDKFSEYQSPSKSKGPLLIGHAPTNRLAKGTGRIIEVVRALEKRYPVSLMLIEGMPYDRAIALKSRCHIFIDQLGDLGYGLNGVEALALGIPTCTSLAEGFAGHYPDHPFIEADEKSLESVLTRLIENRALRSRHAERSIQWVRQTHDSRSVVNKIHRLAGI